MCASKRCGRHFKLDKFDEDVIRNIIDYVLIYDNEHIEIKWNFDDFHIE